ncbi:MAG TPA: hypothetical protein DCL54_04040 [Alphaproteobacteria bacterium]|nr:hypothetical protein [Alphaproteobacteria bacterium]HAJ45736.1 hypothetical protein [Alphaproteobacteria bacterium]
MSDASHDDVSRNGPTDASFEQQSAGPSGAGRRRFDWERLFFTLLFAFGAWVTFWLALFFALAAYVTRAFGWQIQADLAGYARQASSYLGDIFDYVSGRSDEKPFPFRPFATKA